MRSLLSMDHQITGRESQLRVEQDGIHLHRNYIGKLLKKVYAERIHRADLPPKSAHLVIRNS